MVAKMNERAQLVAPGKLLILGIIAIGCMTLIGIDYLGFAKGGDTTAPWATLTSILGYLVGNGVGALRGVPQAPTFAPKEPE